MSNIIQTWKALELYTGIGRWRLQQAVARGAFEALPKSRQRGQRTSFRRDQVRAWYRESYGIDPPGEVTTCAG